MNSLSKSEPKTKLEQKINKYPIRSEKVGGKSELTVYLHKIEGSPEILDKKK
jgi:hypothetical protein